MNTKESPDYPFYGTVYGTGKATIAGNAQDGVCLLYTSSNEATSSEVSFNVYPNLRDNSEVNSLLFKM